MKAPELPTKIYFTILDMGSGYVYAPSLDDNGGTEYIRKDALIEWVEEQLAILAKQTLLHPDDDMFWGQKNAYKQMKDKLNSL